MQEMIDKIDRVLSQWNVTKGAHGLSPELIEEGKQILAEGKKNAQA